MGEGASDNAPVGEKAVTCEEGGTRGDKTWIESSSRERCGKKEVNRIRSSVSFGNW